MNISCRADELALQRCLVTMHDMFRDRHYPDRDVGLTVVADGITLSPFAWQADTHAVLAEHLLRAPTPLILAPPPDGVPTALLVIWKPLVGHHDLLQIVQPLWEESQYQNDSDLPLYAWPPPHLILLTMTPLRNTDWKELAKYTKTTRIEAFHQGEVEFNRTRHEYVPRHTLLPNAEAVRVLQALNTTGQQCPRILQTDIICRYYGGHVGDVFCIYRHDVHTGESELTYRIVSP